MIAGVSCSRAVQGPFHFSYFEASQKNHISLPHPQQRKGRCGWTTETVPYKSCLCPSSALFLLLTLMRKRAFPARVNKDSVADAAWREQSCGSSRKTAKEKEKYSGSNSTSSSPAAQPPTPWSLPPLTQGLAQTALENFTEDWSITKTTFWFSAWRIVLHINTWGMQKQTVTATVLEGKNTWFDLRKRWKLAGPSSS